MIRYQHLPISYLVVVVLGCSSGSNQATPTGSGGVASGGTVSTCVTGSERCPCYGNSTCDAGLTCLSNLCVAASTAGGSSASPSNTPNGGTLPASSITLAGSTPSYGGSSIAPTLPNGGTSAMGGTTVSPSGGSMALGGSTSAGGAVATGGTTITQSNGGTNASGGSSAQGGTTSTGGTLNTGGATCTDTTSDWRNCGACGHVCANNGDGCGSKCCVAGQCAPWYGPCFKRSSGFTTCDQACTHIGAICLARGCDQDTNTWRGWGAASENSCPGLVGGSQVDTSACDKELPYSGTSTTVRCCCTEP